MTIAGTFNDSFQDVIVIKKKKNESAINTQEAEPHLHVSGV